MNSQELYHHGILGQKHGKRNASHYPLNQEDFSPEELKNGAKESVWAQDGDKGPEKVKAPEKPTVKNKEYYKSKKASELTDDEINAAIRRIQIEDQYDKMTGQNQPVKETESFGKKLVRDFAKQTVTTIASQAAGKIGQNVVSSIFDSATDNAKKQREKEKEKSAILAEKKMIKSVEKKMAKDKDARNLTSKELEFYAKRYEQEEKVNKLFGVDNASIENNEISDAVKTLMTTNSQRKYDNVLYDLTPDTASTVQKMIENLSKIQNKTSSNNKSNKNTKNTKKHTRIEERRGPRTSSDSTKFDVKSNNDIAYLKDLYDKRYNR